MCWLTVDRFHVLLALFTFVAITLARPDGLRLVATEPSATGHSSAPLYEVYNRNNGQFGVKDNVPSTHTSDEKRQNKAESNVTLDTRTPPKIKNQLQLMDIKVETSHPGVAIPIDADEELHLLEEQTKKTVHKNNNIYNYKVTPSTNNGLSTWILLSGQPSTTSKPAVDKNDKPNKTVTKLQEKTRPSTTHTKKVATTTPKIPSVTPSSNHSIGNSSSKTVTEVKETKHKVATIKPITNTSTVKIVKVQRTTKPTSTTTKMITTTLADSTPTTTEATSNNSVTIENREGDSELPVKKPNGSTTTKKPPKNGSTTVAPKRKRTKPKRKNKPAVNEKTVNGTKTVKVGNKNKEKPISTQIYNYLSREIMPTVGVGLVGLMVTAGLASYFLYPFGGVPVRRAYEADRKEDKYYYNDDYASGGQAEEDVISKVMAGMPSSLSNSNYQDFKYPNPVLKDNTRYQSSISDSYSNYKTNVNAHNTHTNEVNSYQPDYSPENIYSNHALGYNAADNGFSRKKLNNDYSTPGYKQEVVTEHQKEIGYTVSSLGRNQAGQNQVFVVGNTPKEAMVTPAAVPEHGPRNLKIRRRKREIKVENQKRIEDNEIDGDDDYKHVLRITTVRGENIVPLKLSTRFKIADLNKKPDTTTEPIELSSTTEVSQTTASPTVVVYPVGQRENIKVETTTDKDAIETTMRTTYLLDNTSDSEVASNEISPSKPSIHFDDDKEHYSFFKFIRNLIDIKLKLGLAVMQHTAEAIQRYVHEFQRKMNYTVDHLHHDYNYTRPTPSKKLY